MKLTKKALSAIVTLLILLTLLFNSFVIIPTGYTGVRSTFGRIDPNTVPNGFNWKVPFIQKIEQVNNKQQDISFSDRVWSETASRTAIYYQDVTVTYQINPEKSAWIYAHVNDYRHTLVSSGLVSSAIKASSKPLADSDATKRSIIEPAAMENIQKALDEKYGENVVIINKVVIGNADFDESYNAAIAAKQNAQLAAETQAIENQKAIEKAKADAEVKKTQAQAEADAKVIQAQGEADANRIKDASLTTKVLEDKKLEKWDGQLPKYVGNSDGAAVMIDLND